MESKYILMEIGCGMSELTLRLGLGVLGLVEVTTEGPGGTRGGVAPAPGTLAVCARPSVILKSEPAPVGDIMLSSNPPAKLTCCMTDNLSGIKFWSADHEAEDAA